MESLNSTYGSFFGVSTRNRGYPFPDVYRTRVVWSSNGYERLKLGNTDSPEVIATWCASRAYRANNIYDPDVARGLSQWTVKGHKELAAIYKYYMVTRATCHAYFRNVSSTVTGSWHNAFIFTTDETRGDPTPGNQLTRSVMRMTYPRAKMKVWRDESINYMKLKYSWRPSYEFPARNPYEDENNWLDFGVQEAPHPIHFHVGVVMDDLAGPTSETIALCIYQVEVMIIYDIICVRQNFSIGQAGLASMFSATPIEDLAGLGEDPDENGDPTEWSNDPTAPSGNPAMVAEADT